MIQAFKSILIKPPGTTIIIAHRLATVRNCDLDLYLEGGHVGARGTFDEVRAQSAVFDHQAQLLGL